ncbi:hypothetical protein [Hymenobacter sp. PAMC 26628]|uniref:hypothetical protein n=1 Tax=Hymenobacter sp. PAMC 26628 TaxID=1484118 RepID=UPI000A6C2711|nr:hypothetical protein [Hymenobacter sp. PAMC 26628]
MKIQNLTEFYYVVEDIKGMYYDSKQGFTGNLERQLQYQLKFCQEYGKTMAYMDSTMIGTISGPPGEVGSKILHTTTQGEYKANNDQGGRNEIVIANLSICQIYSYWEDYYRGLVAIDLGIKKNELLSDIFGDIRLLRNSILHNRGIATSDLSKCKIITWFTRGENIQIGADEFKFIMTHIGQEINRIARLIKDLG